MNSEQNNKMEVILRCHFNFHHKMEVILVGKGYFTWFHLVKVVLDGFRWLLVRINNLFRFSYFTTVYLCHMECNFQWRKEFLCSATVSSATSWPQHHLLYFFPTKTATSSTHLHGEQCHLARLLVFLQLKELRLQIDKNFNLVEETVENENKEQRDLSLSY